MRGCRRVKLGLVAATAAISQLLTAPSASAHPPADYYTYLTWYVTAVENYQLAGGISTLDRVRVSIVNGANAWNALNPGPTFTYNGYSTRAPIVAPGCDSASRSFVFQRDLPEPDRLAEAWLCGELSGGLRADSFHVTFDTRSWHSDTTPPTPGLFDRWSVSSHEFGHVAGHWGHWPETSTRCQNNANQLTMCPVVFPSTIYMRDLGDHDIHTYEAQY